MKPAYLVLLGLSAMAQTTGLPQYGVLLEGTADKPRLVNNSPHRIVAYAVRYDNQKRSSLVSMLGQVRTQPISSVGIAPGDWVVFGQAGTLGGNGGVGGTRDARGLRFQHTSASLDAVLFEDGYVVGPDQGGMFDRLTSQIKDEQEVAALLLNTTDREAAWATIQSIASSPPASLARIWCVLQATLRIIESSSPVSEML